MLLGWHCLMVQSLLLRHSLILHHSFPIHRLAMVHAGLSHAMVRMVKHRLVVHVRLHTHWQRTRLCIHVTANLLQRVTVVLPVCNTVLLLKKEQSTEGNMTEKKKMTQQRKGAFFSHVMPILSLDMCNVF